MQAAAGIVAQPLPIENIQLRADRFRGLHYREMTEEQRRLLFNVVNSAASSRRRPDNADENRIALPSCCDSSPTSGLRSNVLNGPLPVVLVTARARFVREMALEAVLRQWQSAGAEHRAHAMPEDAGTALRFATELLDTRFVSDATFAAALDAFGERGLVNLMVVMGHANIRCAQHALAGAPCVL